MDIQVVTVIQAWRALNQARRNKVAPLQLTTKENKLNRLIAKLNKEQRDEFVKYTEEGTP